MFQRSDFPTFGRSDALPTVLCFQSLPHSFIFGILQLLYLPLLRKQPGCTQTIPILELFRFFDFQTFGLLDSSTFGPLGLFDSWTLRLFDSSNSSTLQLLDSQTLRCSDVPTCGRSDLPTFPDLFGWP